MFLLQGESRAKEITEKLSRLLSTNADENFGVRTSVTIGSRCHGYTRPLCR